MILKYTGPAPSRELARALVERNRFACNSLGLDALGRGRLLVVCVSDRMPDRLTVIGGTNDSAVAADAIRKIRLPTGFSPGVCLQYARDWGLWDLRP